MPRPLRIGAVLAVVLAALSLFLPYLLVYDPWGWLVWGRELAHLDLATADGMSWKPLPVLIDAPLSLLGDSAAPKAWLLVARSGWLLAPLLAAWLAASLAGEGTRRWRLVAAVLAAASVALTGDAFTPPARQFSGGLSEPLLVALVLGAVVAALQRRPALALWLGVGASLLRPECWPFLALWAVLAVRAEPRLRLQALAAAALIPIAWFVPDLLGAGDPLAGSENARGGPIEAGEAFEVLGRALAAPLVAAWIGIVLFLARRNPADGRDRALTVLLAGAAAWVLVVAAMAMVGYAGLPRFLAPATAAVAIVGAVGVARAGAHSFAGGPPRPLLAATTVAALLVASAGIGLRAAEVPGDLREVDRQAMLIDGLFDLSDQVGAERLTSCGGEVRLANLLTPPTALAWRLDRPLASVRIVPHPRYGVALSTRPLPGKLLMRVGRWRATQLPC
ncbi:MAG TPA: hypothetical protein VF729_07340 [Solirubrobacterales bacterium]